MCFEAGRCKKLGVMHGFLTYAGRKPVSYAVSDECLIQSRKGVLREFFKMENFYRGIELMDPQRIVVKLQLRTLRGVVNDINRILKLRGYKINTGGARWKSPISLMKAA